MAPEYVASVTLDHGRAPTFKIWLATEFFVSLKGSIFEFGGVFFFMYCTTSSLEYLRSSCTFGGEEPPECGPFSELMALSIAPLVVLAITMYGMFASAAHYNPAITIAYAVNMRFSLFRSLMYILFQFAGAVAGAQLVQTTTCNTKDHECMQSLLTPKYQQDVDYFTPYFVFTVFLVLTHLWSIRRYQNPVAPVAIASIYFLFSLCQHGLNGFITLNPYQSLALSIKYDVVVNASSTMWAASILGGVVGAVLDFLLMANWLPPPTVRRFGYKHKFVAMSSVPYAEFRDWRGDEPLTNGEQEMKDLGKYMDVSHATEETV